MHILKQHSFPIEQIGDLVGLERRLANFYMKLTFPVRLLAYSQRFDVAPVLAKLAPQEQQLSVLDLVVRPLLRAIDAQQQPSEAQHERLLAPAMVLRAMPPGHLHYLLDLVADEPALTLALSELAQATAGEGEPALWATLDDLLWRLLWRYRWVRSTTDFYNALGDHHLRSAQYVLVTWEPSEIQGSALVQSLAYATGRPVAFLETLPPILPCAYRVSERRRRLEPEEPGYPYYTVLHAYDARGTWDATTLHALLDTKADVAVAVDIHTYPTHQAMRIAEAAYNTARVLQQDLAVKDTRAERVYHDSQQVMHQLASESLHEVQIAVLVGGATEEELEHNATALQHRMGSTLRLARECGPQGELIKFWSLTPRQQIDAPHRPRTMLSHGVGCAAGLIGFHRANRTDGILWGVDGQRRAPLFYDLFADKQAAHMVVLGKSGYGKTFFLNVVTMRSAALEGHQVIGIDAFENGVKVAQAIGGSGARCFMVGQNTPINILDIVHDPATEEDWIVPQVQHALGLMAQLLGKPGTALEGKLSWVNYDFSNGESGVLDRALSDLYAGVTPNADTATTPLLQDLIVELERIQEPEARHLARELRLKLFGSVTSRIATATGQLFNAPSAIRWDFSYDVVYYDFSAVFRNALRTLPFYYALAIGAINRFMRDPRRDRLRRTLLIIDEFNYAARTEAVARMAAEICKVARKYGIGLMAVDQNPLTFLGSDNGLFIFENAAAKVLFHLDDHPARQIAEVISDLQPGHIDFLPHARVGEAIAVFGNDVHLMVVEPTPLELHAFA